EERNEILYRSDDNQEINSTSLTESNSSLLISSKQTAEIIEPINTNIKYNDKSYAIRCRKSQISRSLINNCLIQDLTSTEYFVFE
ncbi:26065_t:CDS:1, partial [Racocetra persica]